MTLPAHSPGGRQVTIVMYHYVRDLEHSRYPALKGLSIGRFVRQLDRVQACYVPITMEQLLEALESPDRVLPQNAALLTFDDGYADHFAHVFPLLDRRGIQGCFYPPAQAILEHRVLDVNKLHFVVASADDPRALLHRVLGAVAEVAPDLPLRSSEQYVREFGGGHRYDGAEVTTIKRLLQRELPLAIRQAVLQRLFAQYVTADEETFARELYLSLDQIDCMCHRGMHFGSHGYSHAWLNRLPPDAQALEIDRALSFLGQFGVLGEGWTMCYPYGGYDETLLGLLRVRGCRAGLGVEARVADLDRDERLALPRLDTNDLPS